MKSILKILIISFVAFIASCNLYPDWTNYVEYSDVYPICGEYYVQDYDMNTDTVIADGEWYILYIYNKSYNPTKDSIWIDSRLGHPAGVSDYAFKYKIKCKADTVNLSFDVERAGDVSGSNVNPLDSAISVTITKSKIWDLSDGIEDPTPDSIFFELSYYNKFGNLSASYVVKGHRKTGWENPNFDDPM
ncbi:MAG: hypothetical protein JXR68_01185 [Bacteroidales bacterium]|nr:hypothetical protein [Bacteroidales bacterium]